MKYFAVPIIIITIATLLDSGCKGDGGSSIELEPEFEWNGDAFAIRNGMPWNAKCSTVRSSSYPGKFGLLFMLLDGKGLDRNGISFRHLPYKTGKYYPLQLEYDGTQADSVLTCSCTTTIDGDLVGDVYIILKDSAAVITIDSIDGVGNISGTFSGTFVRMLIFDKPLDTASPDTFVFSDGKYRARVVN